MDTQERYKSKDRLSLVLGGLLLVIFAVGFVHTAVFVGESVSSFEGITGFILGVLASVVALLSYNIGVFVFEKRIKNNKI